MCDSQPAITFNKRRPKFVVPGAWLDPQMQNLFEMHYFQGSKELVPTGWQAVDEDKTYPTLSSRNVQQPSDVDQESTNDFEMTSGPAGSESSDEDDDSSSPGFDSSTRIVDESSEDEHSNPIGSSVCQAISLAHRPFDPKTPRLI